MEHIPLKKLVLSARNVRTNVEDATAIADLVASIEQHGLLNPLVVVNGKKPEVVAGGRRLRALEQLVDEGKLPADYAVPVQLVDAAAAEEVSLAENFIRKDMRPYEIYRAFRLVQDGNPDLTAADLAKRFGLAEKRAAKILRLGNLHPDVFELYVTGQIKDDLAQAFAATSNHDLQQQALVAWRNSDSWEKNNARFIHKALGMADHQVRNNLAYVGKAAYLEAGGRIEEDLFSDAINVLDVELLANMVADKNAEIVRAAAQRCNREVEFLTEPPKDANGYIGWNLQVRPTYGELDAASEERVAEIEATLEDPQEGDDELTIEQAEALEDERDSILLKRPIVLPEDGRIGILMDRGQVQFWKIPEPVEASDTPDSDEPPVEESAAPSRRALDTMAVMRRERLIERTKADINAQANAIDLLLFTVARSCFMGLRNHETRGLSTVEDRYWTGEHWMQAEPSEGFALFQQTIDRNQLAAEMLATMTEAQIATTKSQHIKWLAAFSAPQPWQSTPEFWELFRKSQIVAMLEPVAPTWWEKTRGVTQGELRRQAHRLCAGEIEAAVSGIPQEELDAALAWVPAWLRFADEEPAA